MKESTRSFISSVISSDDNAWLGLDDTDIAKFKSPLEETKRKPFVQQLIDELRPPIISKINK